LSGIQQNGGCGHVFDEELNQTMIQNIKDVMKDLLISFDLTAEDLK
jgi:hypothetical protein